LGSVPCALAQGIFADGFESGTLCAWSNAPSHFEVPGNGLDDDCDGDIDEPADVCDAGLPSNSGDPFQYAAALDLCQMTTEIDPQWGLISAALTLADGTGLPAAQSRSIRSAFGSANFPQAGVAMAVLSTGAAAATGQTNPPHVAFQPGLDTGTESPAPADWLAANGGLFPTLSSCPGSVGVTAFNPVLLTLRIRVPGNARSFRLSASFLGSEFPEWVCSPYFDLVVVLLDSGFSGLPANPVDKNLAFYRTPAGVVYPVGVDLAWGDTGLFTQCLNGPTGCAGGAVPGTISTCTGTTGLALTGMDVVNPPGIPPHPGWCGASNLAGGGTSWLIVRGNVQPGEIIDLRLAVWDTSDDLYDSVLLLDDFRWSTDVAEPGTTQN
jgi:hypothetical protein